MEKYICCDWGLGFRMTTDIIDTKKDPRDIYVEKISQNIRSLKEFSEDDFEAIMYEINQLKRIQHVPHKTVQIYNNFKKSYIKIDEGISTLMHLIWANGIETCNSCEDNVPVGYVWLEFRSSDDLQRFLKIVFDDVPSENELYERAFLEYEHKKNAWIYDTSVVRDDGEDEDDIGTREITATISLRFPNTDKDFIQDKLTQYWRNNKSTDLDRICIN